jgi:glucokinase
LQKFLGGMVLSLGIDIGGTKILGAAVSPGGEVLAERRVQSPAREPDLMVDTVSRLILELIAEHGEPQAIGVAAAGLIDRSRSVVLYSPNLNWRNEPLRARIEQKISRPLIIENDANAAGWAEFKFGAAQAYSSMAMLTLGTGVGGAIVDGGHLLRGGFGVGGELGHITLVSDGHLCGCGRRGCVEQYASGTALLKEIVALANSDDESGSLVRKLRSERGQLTGHEAYEAVEANDPGTLARIDQLAGYLSRAMASLVAVLDPEVFVIGGGLSELGDRLLKPLRDKLAGEIPASGFRPVAGIMPATFSNQAGVIGAAQLARETLG